MASREFVSYSYQLEKGVVKLYAKVAIGATGAPTLTETSSTSGNPSKGIRTVTRSAAGKYKIYFGKSDVTGIQHDRYQRALMVYGSIINSTVGVVNGIQILDDQSAAATPYIEIATLGINAGAVAAVDPNNGDSLVLEITLKNSTV